MAIYNIFWIVIIYGFIGWCIEVIYAACNQGTFINRGFLNGPICPIYGFGVLIVLLFLDPIKNNFILLYAGAVIFTSVLEFITGYVMEVIFKDKWWDYSKEPFNIKGYICLKFSLLWGIGAVMIVRVVHPSICSVVELIPIKIGVLILIFLYIIFSVDLVITAIEAYKLPRRLRAIEEIEHLLSSVSEEIGTSLSEKTVDIIKANENLKKKYIDMINSRNIVHKRILKAFPNMENGKHGSIVKKIKEEFKTIE